MYKRNKHLCFSQARTMSNSVNDILFIQTGGTIDKDYPKTIGGYNFEIGQPAVERVFSKVKPSVGFDYKLTSVCLKDSQEITQTDRISLAKCILAAKQQKIIVTHGTDTIIDTAKFIQTYLKAKLAAYTNLFIGDKNIIFVGSFLPERFKDSDADLNIGTALGALEVLQMVSDRGEDAGNKSVLGVYIAMGGRVIPAETATRNLETGLFCQSDECHSWIF